jgi:hypothetical protein
MCFNGDDSGPDIWLTIENGKYVPAPPMVYMPGLRQIQDRLHRKAYHTTPNFTRGTDSVRLPVNLTMSKSSSTNCPLMASAQPLPETPNPEAIVSSVADQNINPTMPAPDNALTDAAKLPETPPEEPPAASPEAQPKVQQEAQPEEANQANGSTRSSTDSASSSVSDITPPSPSASSSSSLRSILKKPSTPTTEATESETGAESDGGNDENDEIKQRKVKRPKTKKSVSFTDETAPAAQSPLSAAPSPPRSAAAEGAAIARQLVQREDAFKGAGRDTKRFGGRVGSADLGNGRGQSRQGIDRTHKGREAQKNGNNPRGEKHTRSTGGGMDVPKKEQGRQLTNGGERAARARMTRYLFADDEDGSNVDDEIPGRWP